MHHTHTRPHTSDYSAPSPPPTGHCCYWRCSQSPTSWWTRWGCYRDQSFGRRNVSWFLAQVAPALAARRCPPWSWTLPLCSPPQSRTICSCPLFRAPPWSRMWWSCHPSLSYPAESSCPLHSACPLRSPPQVCHHAQRPPLNQTVSVSQRTWAPARHCILQVGTHVDTIVWWLEWIFGAADLMENMTECISVDCFLSQDIQLPFVLSPSRKPVHPSDEQCL